MPLPIGDEKIFGADLVLTINKDEHAISASPPVEQPAAQHHTAAGMCIDWLEIGVAQASTV